MHDLRVWPGVVADGSEFSTTPGKAKSSNDQMERLGKASLEHLFIVIPDTFIT
jgi:hypothetical protein